MIIYYLSDSVKPITTSLLDKIYHYLLRILRNKTRSVMTVGCCCCCYQWGHSLFQWALQPWACSRHNTVCLTDITLLKIFIYLAVPSLSCSMWDLVPWPGSEPGPLHWELGVLAVDHQGRPYYFNSCKGTLRRNYYLHFTYVSCGARTGIWIEICLNSKICFLMLMADCHH